MPKVQEQGNSIPSSLHYALTDSQYNKCGARFVRISLLERTSSGLLDLALNFKFYFTYLT